MGRGRAAGALIAVLISGALIDVARGGDLVECEPQRVTGATRDHRGNAGAMARERSRPAACVDLLLAGVGGACAAPAVDASRRPVAGVAARPATARALRAVVGCQAKTSRRCWSSSRRQAHPRASSQWSRWRPRPPRTFGN